MKKTIFLISALVLFLISCQDEEKITNKILAQLEKDGLLISCGSVPTGCNRSCPPGQSCEPMQYNHCYCVRDKTGTSSNQVPNEGSVSIEEKARIDSENSPCVQCLERAQKEHISCYINAGNNAEKKRACDKALSDAIKLCPCPQ